MRPTILLFDVDGTLLSAAGAGRRALERAFEAHCDTATPLRDVRFNGMTDPAIVRAGLERLGRSVETTLVAAILDDYVPLLADELSHADGFQVFPGVTGLLDALADDDRVAVGLGTGNLRAGARLKLAHAGLERYFTFGGFGCDHEQRAELLRIGAARGASLVGCAVDGCRVVVIGDTPYDVTAAREIGAVSIGVGTGGCERDRMRAAGATWVFDDLAAPGVLDAIREGDCT